MESVIQFVFRYSSLIVSNAFGLETLLIMYMTITGPNEKGIIHQYCVHHYHNNKDLNLMLYIFNN